jgi:hypothetical protein
VRKGGENLSGVGRKGMGEAAVGKVGPGVRSRILPPEQGAAALSWTRRSESGRPIFPDGGAQSRLQASFLVTWGAASEFLAKGAPPGMVKSDRQTLLEAMEERHDALIDQLDALNAQVELALAACGTTPRAEDAASG